MTKANGAKRVLIVGATGMVGGLVLSECLARADVREVAVIGRRSLDLRHDKLREHLHDDFGDFGGLSAPFEDRDAAFFCLGAYTGSLPDDAFRKITVDYAVAFGEALRAKSPDAVFCLLSGQGADPSGKSRMAFARYKGEAETALSAMGFARVHCFRPGYIYPVTPRREPNFSYRAMRALYPVLRAVYPNIGVPSEALAHAMVDAALAAPGDAPDAVLENRDIRAMTSAP